MPQARNEERSMDGGQFKRWIQKMQTSIRRSTMNTAMDPMLAQPDCPSICALYLRTWGILDSLQSELLPLDPTTRS